MEMKPEDVTRALAWYEVVGKNVGSVTLPYAELKAIADLLREQNTEIEDLRYDNEYQKQTIYNLTRMLENARTKAIAEFAKRLIGSLIEPDKPWDDPYITESEIDFISKNMMGETK